MLCLCKAILSSYLHSCIEKLLYTDWKKGSMERQQRYKSTLFFKKKDDKLKYNWIENISVHVDDLGFKEELDRIWDLIDPADEKKEANCNVEGENHIDSLDLSTEIELKHEVQEEGEETKQNHEDEVDLGKYMGTNYLKNIVT